MGVKDCEWEARGHRNLEAVSVRLEKALVLVPLLLVRSVLSVSLLLLASPLKSCLAHLLGFCLLTKHHLLFPLFFGKGSQAHLFSIFCIQLCLFRLERLQLGLFGSLHLVPLLLDELERHFVALLPLGLLLVAQLLAELVLESRQHLLRIFTLVKLNYSIFACFSIIDIASFATSLVRLPWRWTGLFLQLALLILVVLNSISVLLHVVDRRVSLLGQLLRVIESRLTFSISHVWHSPTILWRCQ